MTPAAISPLFAASSFQFATPWAFGLLVLALGFWILRRALDHRRSNHSVLPTLAPLAQRTNDSGDGVVPLPRSMRQRLLPLLAVVKALAIVLLVVALARPRLGSGRVQTNTDAVAIQLVVDRSGSMRYTMELDGQRLERLEVVKRVLREFLLGGRDGLEGRPADLIGLVAFARFAETSCPLVKDPRAVSDLVQALQPASQRYEDGTAIGDGLSLAAARLHTAEKELAARTRERDDDRVRIKSKVVVLLTDGEQNAGERSPDEAAALAKDWGVRVYTIGIGAGSAAYQTIRDPIFGERQVQVSASIDETPLKAIAETTGGQYFRAQDGEALLQIYREIDRLEKTQVRTVEYTDYAEWYAPCAAAGSALLLAHTLLSSLWLRRTT